MRRGMSRNEAPSRYTIGDKFTLLQLAKLPSNSDLEHASSSGAVLGCLAEGRARGAPWEEQPPVSAVFVCNTRQ
jgi:hypothetical protein